MESPIFLPAAGEGQSWTTGTTAWQLVPHCSQNIVRDGQPVIKGGEESGPGGRGGTPALSLNTPDYNHMKYGTVPLVIFSGIKGTHVIKNSRTNYQAGGERE